LRFIIVSAIIVVWVALISMVIDGCKAEYISRFGSIIVLVGAMGEYLLMNNKLNKIYEAIEIASMPYTDVVISDSSKILTVTIHITVLLGTIVWGYGDLFVNMIR